jgi:hypothetical protein
MTDRLGLAISVVEPSELEASSIPTNPKEFKEIQ